MASPGRDRCRSIGLSGLPRLSRSRPLEPNLSLFVGPTRLSVESADICMRINHLPCRLSYKSTSHDLLNVKAITIVDAVIIFGFNSPTSSRSGLVVARAGL